MNLSTVKTHSKNPSRNMGMIYDIAIAWQAGKKEAAKRALKFSDIRIQEFVQTVIQHHWMDDRMLREMFL